MKNHGLHVIECDFSVLCDFMYFLLEFVEVSRDLEKFTGIWRSFKGFGEVLRDLEKF